MECRVSLVVHAKYPQQVTSEFLKRHLITKPPRMGRGNSYADPEYLTHVPAWGSIQITRAMIDLLRLGHCLGSPDDALAKETDDRFASQRFLIPTSNTTTTSNPDNEKDKNKNEQIPMADKFLFISETCLPVQTLSECVRAFFGDKELYQKDKSAKAETTPTRDSMETPSKEDEGSGTPADSGDMKDNEEGDKSKSVTSGDGNNSATNTITSVSTTATGTRPITPWDMSWVNGRNRSTPGTPRNKYERDQFADIYRMVHGHYRWKADQWLCLSRPHATAILNIDRHMPHYHQLWNSFKNISASDEMYFPCCLAVLHILESSQQQQQQQSQQQQPKQEQPQHAGDSNQQQSQQPVVKEEPTQQQEDAQNQYQVALRPVTYTDWSEGMRNPATFSKGVADLERVAKLARKQGSVFARKFALKRIVDDDTAPITGAITAQEWMTVMKHCQDREKEEEENAKTFFSAETAAAESTFGRTTSTDNMEQGRRQEMKQTEHGASEE